MELKVLSVLDCEQVRLWRNEQLEILRTSFPLTREMQIDFYRNVICDRNSNARFWGIWENIEYYQFRNDGTTYKENDISFIGMCGLENISLENRSAEVSLIMKPPMVDADLSEALRTILHKGFCSLNLENIYTEVYTCNLIVGEWIRQYETITQKERCPVLPARKFWNGKYYDSVYLNFNRTEFETYENTLT